MMTISYKELESSTRGKVLWQTACLALIWVVWREKKTLGSSRTRRGLQRIVGISFISLPPFRSLVPQLLRHSP